MCYSVFFFSSRRRHTRYWRDWSSDVCSSDLGSGAEVGCADGAGAYQEDGLEELGRPRGGDRRGGSRRAHGEGASVSGPSGSRSEERRVGKECRSRWSPDHLKKKIIEYLSTQT